MAAAAMAAPDGGEQLAVRDLVNLATGSSTGTGAAIATAAVQIKQELVENVDDWGRSAAKRLRTGVESAADPAWQRLTTPHDFAHFPFVKTEQLHTDQSWQRLAMASRESEEDVLGVTEEDNATDAGRDETTRISAPAMESPKQTASTDADGEGKAGGQLSEYEQTRLANIKRNEAELARLGLRGATAELAARDQRKTEAVKRKRAPKAIEPAAPTRRSSRKRGGGMAVAFTEGAMPTTASRDSETDTADENPSDVERERDTTELSTAADPTSASARAAAPPGGQTRRATRSQRAPFVPLKVGDHVLVPRVHRPGGPHLAIICKEAVAEVGKQWKVTYDDGYSMLRHVPVGNLTKVTPEEADERVQREKGNVAKRNQLASSNQAPAIEVAQSEGKTIAQVVADIKRKLGLKQFHSKKILRKIAAELDVDTEWQSRH